MTDIIISKDLFKKYFDIDGFHILKHPKNMNITNAIKEKRYKFDLSTDAESGSFPVVLFLSLKKNGETDYNVISRQNDTCRISEFYETMNELDERSSLEVVKKYDENSRFDIQKIYDEERKHQLTDVQKKIDELSHKIIDSEKLCQQLNSQKEEIIKTQNDLPTNDSSQLREHFRQRFDDSHYSIIQSQQISTKIEKQNESQPISAKICQNDNLTKFEKQISTSRSHSLIQIIFLSLIALFLSMVYKML